MRDIKVNIHNEFDIVVTDSRTGKEKSRKKAYNIILDAFWSKFLSNQNYKCLDYIVFGSGTTTPEKTDTTLTSRLGGKATTVLSEDWSDFDENRVVKARRSIRLQDTEFQNTTISEVGFSYDGTNVVTKSLLKDQNGNPLAISKGLYDVVDIYGTFFVSVPEQDDVWVLSYTEFRNTSSNFMRAILMTPYQTFDSPQFNLSSICQESAYQAVNGSITYQVANKTLTYTLSNVIASNGNFTGGIQVLIGFSEGVRIKLPITGFAQPQIVKEVLGTGDGVTKDWNPQFFPVTDYSDAKLYVNDVEVSATFEVLPICPTKYVGNQLLVKGHARNEKENFANDVMDIDEIVAASSESIYHSDDGVNWTYYTAGAPFGGSTLAIPSELKRKRWWKGGTLRSAQWAAKKMIHASSAPANGETITLTYTPDSIAKDSNHALNNMSVVLSFNEYTPA